MILYLLDLTGVFAFAYFGAYTARSRGLNKWGMFACAFLTALGGGTIREVMLTPHPPLYFYNYTYLLVVLIGAACAWYIRHRTRKFLAVMYILDAIGLATFAYLGAVAAHKAGLGLPIMFIFAMLTGAGGGVLSEVITNHRPQVFLRGKYLWPPVIVAVLFWVNLRVSLFPTAFIIGAGVTLRLCELYAKRLSGFIGRSFWSNRPAKLASVKYDWQKQPQATLSSE